MFSHVYLGINDFERGFAFYAPLCALLGLELRFRDPDAAWAGWNGPGAGRPLLLIGRPFDGGKAVAGNGQMTALLAPSRQTVDACHRLALELGGSGEGSPGLRPQYHPHYYGAYFRDPDGNKLCVCCHDPE